MAFLFALSLALEAWSIGRARRAIATLLDLVPPTARLVTPARRARSASVGGPGRRPHRGPAGRALGARRTGRRRALDARPGADHRREPAGRQGAGRRGLRRLDQRSGRARDRNARRPPRRRCWPGSCASSRRRRRAAHLRNAGSIASPRSTLRSSSPPRSPSACCHRSLPARAGANGSTARSSCWSSAAPAPSSSPPRSRSSPGWRRRRATACSSRAAPSSRCPATLRAFAFDKTGTLTDGRPARARGRAALRARRARGARAPRGARGTQRASARRGAARLRRGARRCGAARRGVPRLRGQRRLRSVGGRLFWVGSHRYLEERGQETPEVHARLEAMSQAGQTAVVVGNESHVCGLIAVADGVRESARETVAELHRLGIETTVMLTGDNRGTAEAIGRATGALRGARRAPAGRQGRGDRRAGGALRAGGDGRRRDQRRPGPGQRQPRHRHGRRRLATPPSRPPTWLCCPTTCRASPG